MSCAAVATSFLSSSPSSENFSERLLSVMSLRLSPSAATSATKSARLFWRSKSITHMPFSARYLSSSSSVISSTAHTTAFTSPVSALRLPVMVLSSTAFPSPVCFAPRTMYSTCERLTVTFSDVFCLLDKSVILFNEFCIRLPNELLMVFSELFLI